MKYILRFFLVIFLFADTVFGLSFTGSFSGNESEQASAMIKQANISGGMIIHVGIGNGAMTKALSPNEFFIVQGLDRDSRKVMAAGKLFFDKKINDRVSAVHLKNGKLPYIDRLINLAIIEDNSISRDEVLRVLVPNGKALIKKGDKWEMLIKPWPKTIDQWTHYMHDPGNNAVAHDEEIGEPKHYQWDGGPAWSRHHDHLASVPAMVTANGKLFYMIDFGLGYSIYLPPAWKLVARDAFNGAVLWEKNIDEWWTHLWPLKSGPANLPRRLVAVDNEVYMPESLMANVVAMDANTGKVLRTYKGTEGTEEMIKIDDYLIVLVSKEMRSFYSKPGDFGPEQESQVPFDKRITKAPIMQHLWTGVRSKKWLTSKRVVKAFKASTGKKLWEKVVNVTPLTLAADKQKVYFHDNNSIIGLDRDSGKQLFKTEPVDVAREWMMSFFGATMVVYKDLIIFAGGEKLHQAWMGWGRDDQGQDKMTAFSTKNGKKLWVADHPYGGYQSPEDILIADGLIWVADTAKKQDEGAWKGHDPYTGKIKKEIPPDVKTGWFHHRCYRAKATDKFILPSRNGIEFIDLNKKHWGLNHWVRSGCLYGMMPANGLIYTTPHNCGCQPGALLSGFNALASTSPTRPLPDKINPEGRLEKGKAYNSIEEKKASKNDWPLFRKGPRRSGNTDMKIGNKLSRSWDVQFNGKVTQPVISGDILIVAEIDSGTVHALNARTGKKVWNYTASGGIDSSPSIYKGRVIFGSADGYIYCLRLQDGELAWQFLAAPQDLRLASYNKFESVWPVNGSVLVKDDQVWAVAGRSFYLDGGCWMYRLNVKTGKVITIAHFNPFNDNGEEIQAGGGLNIQSAMPDVLASYDDTLFMRTLQLDENGKQQPNKKARLYSPYGFLDDAWTPRVYWLYSKTYKGGIGGLKSGKAAPAGRIMIEDGTKLYIYGREQEYYKWTATIEYHLHSVDVEPKKTDVPPEPADKKKRKGKRKKKAVPPLNTIWDVKIPFFARAMVKAGDKLVLAGPPDIVDETVVSQQIPDPKAMDLLEQQDAAYRGETGSIMWIVSADKGKKIAEYKLDELPSFDGMSAANGCIYLSTENGNLICFMGD